MIAFLNHNQAAGERCVYILLSATSINRKRSTLHSILSTGHPTEVIQALGSTDFLTRRSGYYLIRGTVNSRIPAWNGCPQGYSSSNPLLRKGFSKYNGRHHTIGYFFRSTKQKIQLHLFGILHAGISIESQAGPPLF